ncbi:putative membrane protein [Emiliania huxleyi virus 18]|nr:putative membrane protein [Emiliania huxleyi virus 18]
MEQFDHEYVGSSRCTTFNIASVNTEKCSGCVSGTSGQCKSNEDVCYPKTGASCPPATTECFATGASDVDWPLPPPPEPPPPPPPPPIVPSHERAIGYCDTSSSLIDSCVPCIRESNCPDGVKCNGAAWCPNKPTLLCGQPECESTPFSPPPSPPYPPPLPDLIWCDYTPSTKRQVWSSVAISPIDATSRTLVSNGVIYTSRMSGNTWNDVEIQEDEKYSPYFTDVSMDSYATDQLVTAAGTKDYVSVPIHTNDAGETWLRLDNLPSANWITSSMDTSGNKQLIAAVYGYVYASFNKGLNWAKVPLGSVDLYDIDESDTMFTSVSVSGDGRHAVVASGAPPDDNGPTRQYTKQSSGTMYFCNEFEENIVSGCWTTLASVTTHDWASVSLSEDAMFLSAVDRGGYIYTSKYQPEINDIGHILVPKISYGIHDWSSIDVSSNGMVQVAAAGTGPLFERTPGPLFISNDYGNTWLQENIPNKLWTKVSVYASSEHRIIMATYASEVYGGYYVTDSNINTCTQTFSIFPAPCTTPLSSPPPPPPPPVQVLDLLSNDKYEDPRSEFDSYDMDKPVDDMSFVDSTTGRPWGECGHFSWEWWGIDLGSEVFVRYVRLQNRNDCCEERLTQVEIYFGSTANTYAGNTLLKSDVHVLSNVMLEVELNAVGRYMYFRRPPEKYLEDEEPGLTLCKLYVFTSPPPSPPPPLSPRHRHARPRQFHHLRLFHRRRHHHHRRHLLQFIHHHRRNRYHRRHHHHHQRHHRHRRRHHHHQRHHRHRRRHYHQLLPRHHIHRHFLLVHYVLRHRHLYHHHLHHQVHHQVHHHHNHHCFHHHHHHLYRRRH